MVARLSRRTWVSFEEYRWANSRKRRRTFRPNDQAAIRRQRQEMADAADDDRLHLSAISLDEISKGLTILPAGKRRNALEESIEGTLRSWFGGRILPVTPGIGERWGKLAGARQLSGKPLSVADGLIAATALEHGLTVVTRNVPDFAGLGVNLFNPWEAV